MNIISKKIEKALNAQLVIEGEASFKYLAMASWCEKEGLEGGSEFFYTHAIEENDHMMKIFRYINEVGGHAEAPAIRQPQLEFNSIQEVCETAFAHERKVSEAIHKIVDLTVKENDHTTNDFLRFFVAEQREEEVLFQRVIDKLNLIGTGPQSNYFIDQELTRLNKSRDTAE